VSDHAVLMFLKRSVRITTVAGLVAVLGYWLVEAMNPAIKAKVAAAEPGQASLVNGFVVPLEQFETRVKRRNGAMPGDPDAILLLAISDACKACQRQAPQWIKLADELGLTQKDAVRVVSFGGDALAGPLLASLSARSVPWTLSEAEPGSGFGSRTAIGATPTIVLLDRHASVRLVTHSLTPTTLGLLRDSVSNLHLVTSLASSIQVSK